MVGGDAGTGVPTSWGYVALFTGDELSGRDRGVSAGFDCQNLEFVTGISQEKLRGHLKLGDHWRKINQGPSGFPEKQSRLQFHTVLSVSQPRSLE